MSSTREAGGGGARLCTLSLQQEGWPSVMLSSQTLCLGFFNGWDRKKNQQPEPKSRKQWEFSWHPWVFLWCHEKAQRSWRAGIKYDVLAYSEFPSATNFAVKGLFCIRERSQGMSWIQGQGINSPRDSLTRTFLFVCLCASFAIWWLWSVLQHVLKPSLANKVEARRLKSSLWLQ